MDLKEEEILGEFVEQHRSEIVKLVRNTEEREHTSYRVAR